MDHFTSQVSPWMLAAASATRLGQTLTDFAATCHIFEAQRTTLDASTVADIDEIIEQALHAGAESIAEIYRSLPSDQQDLLWEALRQMDDTLDGNGGKDIFDGIVARLKARLEDA